MNVEIPVINLTIINETADEDKQEKIACLHNWFQEQKPQEEIV